MIKYNLLMLT